MSRDPAADRERLLAVHALARGGRHGEAATLAEDALAGGFEHPLFLNLAALRLEQQGRIVQAEGLLRRAVALAPEEVAARNALGLCLMRQERYDEALVQFDALLERAASLPFVHAGRGAALSALGRVAAAEASYLRALELDANQAVALSGLAMLASNRGAYAEARSKAMRALELLPGHFEALMSLAAADLGERQLDDAERGVRNLMQMPQLSAVQRAHASGLLGDVLDARNVPDQAFDAYADCNRALRADYAAACAAEGDALAYVRVLDDYFARAEPLPWRTAVPPVQPPPLTGATGHVFLLGFPRSGTTLLEVILEGHPQVVSLEEHESLIDGVREFMSGPADLTRLALAAAPTLETFRAAYWRRVAEAGVHAAGKVFVDKHPLNTLKLPLIRRFFPDAKILFACRDPRDIVLSCFRHRFKMSAPMYELLTLEGGARYYDAVMRLAVRFSTLFALDICLIRHEDVVTGFGREMKRICDFLNLEWDPAMGDFALRTRERTTLTPSTAQLARGLNTEGLGHWRRYLAQMAPVLPVLEPWIKRFYYDEEPVRPA